VQTEEDVKRLNGLNTSIAYLKLINVPTMFDIGSLQADPTTEFLELDMIDEKTYKIVNQDFLFAK
jgi:hypothetical protein